MAHRVPQGIVLGPLHIHIDFAAVECRVLLHIEHSVDETHVYIKLILADLLTLLCFLPVLVTPGIWMSDNYAQFNIKSFPVSGL